MVNGKLEGKQKAYDEQGELIKDSFFKNGVEVK